MQRIQPYRTVPTGIDTSAGAVKNKNPGGFVGSIQEVTFGLSIVAQLVTLIMSFVAFSQGGIPDVLNTVLILETVVQCVEVRIRPHPLASATLT